MKTLKLILIVILYGLTSIIAKAQPSGVYMNAADFVSQKLSYEIDCATQKHKIKLNEFLGKSYITIVHDGKSVNLEKSEVYGYRDCDASYRFVASSHYQILNPGEEIHLYKHTVLGSKNQSGVDHYFFSVSASGQVIELTITNLKKAFPDNHRFHDALDSEFNVDSQLVKYDSYHKMYRINRLYLNTK